MFFETAIANNIPNYTRESDSAYGETLAPLDYKDELKVKNEAIREFLGSEQAPPRSPARHRKPHAKELPHNKQASRRNEPWRPAFQRIRQHS